MALKTLIITYYWPPAGGSGVQRWLYFVKYFKSFGVDPIVFTADKPNYPILDQSLNSQVPENVVVLKHTIWEPGKVSTKKWSNASGFLPEHPGIFDKIKQYIRANFFIPDARKFWIRPATKRVLKYLKSNPVDFIITTGPPHSIHLIGKKVKEKTGIKWLADFRDPWTEIDYFHHLPLTKSSINKHQKLEKEVLENANIITVVSNTMKQKFEVFNPNCHVITNGYDDVANNKKIEKDKPFTLTHIGMLNADRNPIIFWQAVSELLEFDEIFEQHLQINLVGFVADEVKNSIRKYNLEKFVNYTQYVPNHAVSAIQMKSQVLLLIVNNVPSAKNIITGKLYEYLRAKRPILAIAPLEGDLAAIIDETQTGVVVEFEDKEGMKEIIKMYFKYYLQNKLEIQSQNIEKYHRKNLTEQLVNLLKNN